MVLGTVALVSYSVCCVAFLAIRRLPVLLAAALAWISWGAVAAGLYFGLAR
jgi:hypothetical protein